MMRNESKVPKQVLLAISMMLILVYCLPGCTDKGQRTNPSSILTKPGSQTTTLPASSSAVTTPQGGPTVSRPPKSQVPYSHVSIAEMLMTIPDTLSPLAYVYYVDFAAWQNANGVDPDSYRDFDGNALEGGENSYVYDMFLYPEGETQIVPFGKAPFISGMYPSDENMLESPVREIKIGYGPLDIQQSIHATSYPLNSTIDNMDIIRYEVVKGSFDMAVISQVISSYSSSVDLPQISVLDDINICSWDGEMDFGRRFQPPIFDNMGQGRTLAFMPDIIFGSTKATYTYGMIGASRGELNSLADNLQFREIADNLEKIGAMSAVMSETILSYLQIKQILEDQNAPMDKKLTDLFANADREAPLLGPYKAFAAGLGYDELGLFVVLVLKYESSEMANRDADILKTRLESGRNSKDVLWKDELDSWEVWVDGYAVCARLRGKATGYWDDFLWTEPLLVREN
jgi:hypothetical protein